MKLFYAAGSPYARIVRVVLRETGLDRPVRRPSFAAMSQPEIKL